MKLKVGKKYRNRLNEVKEIVQDKGIQLMWRFRDKADLGYTAGGRFSVAFAEHELDLIEEIDEIDETPETYFVEQQEDGSFMKVVNHGTKPIYTQGLDGKVEKIMPEEPEAGRQKTIGEVYRDMILEDAARPPINEWRVTAHDVPSISTERAKRFNSGKVPMHYVPLDMLQGLARVLEDGAVKYGEDNWRLGAPVNEQIDSLLRHLSKLQSGEVSDAESSLPHVDHMIFNCISLRLALEMEGKLEKDPGQGNRVKESK